MAKSWQKAPWLLGSRTANRINKIQISLGNQTSWAEPTVNRSPILAQSFGHRLGKKGCALLAKSVCGHLKQKKIIFWRRPQGAENPGAGKSESGEFLSGQIKSESSNLPWFLGAVTASSIKLPKIQKGQLGGNVD